MCCKTGDERKSKNIENSIEKLEAAETFEILELESLKSENKQILPSSDYNIENICKENDKNSVIEKDKKYQNNVRKKMLLEKSLPSLFSCWDEVIVAHSSDMWADLQGVKTLVCRKEPDL